MWWGVAIGIVLVAILSKIPREFVMSILAISVVSMALRALRSLVFYWTYAAMAS